MTGEEEEQEEQEDGAGEFGLDEETGELLREHTPCASPCVGEAGRLSLEESERVRDERLRLV